MADTKERLQKDIAEAFDFARFILRHPRLLGKIRNGAEVSFVPAASRGLRRTSRTSKRVQSFSAETVFRSL